MKTLLCIAAVLLALSSIEARAGTQLQIQFQQWVYQGHGLAKLMVTLRNPTMKPFARVVWDCDLLDKESHVVGRATLIFHVVPWARWL
jgi:hypothetical protein